MSYSYNPQPPRVWSRVQHACSTINDNNDNTITSGIGSQMLLKGNILQYKKNSSNLTKNQRFSKIAKGQWTNRTKSWATQSQTYSNPNTSSLLRVNYSKIPVPSNALLTSDCSLNFIKDGGNLICNAVADPCTDVVIKTTNNVRCYSTSCSDVPGPPQELCWNNGTQTWYPRQNLTMNNSANKWPEGYKGFVSAVTINPPYLTIDTSGNDSILRFVFNNGSCIPISYFNLYMNGNLLTMVPSNVDNIEIITDRINTFYTTSVSIGNKLYDPKKSFSNNSNNKLVESVPSNTVTNTATSGTRKIIYNIYLKKNNALEIYYTLLQINNKKIEAFCSYYNELIKNETITNINTYLQTFIENKDNLVISFDSYNKINVDIINLLQETPIDSCMYDIIINYKGILKVLWEYNNNASLMKGLITQFEEFKEDSNILNNITLLNEYLEKLKRQYTGIFQEFIVEDIIAATIKPLYSKYHELYGIPHCLDYDPEKLAYIKTIL